MANEIVIKDFLTILDEIKQSLADLGSNITNTQEGGGYDLLKRVISLQLADLNTQLDNALDQINVATSSGPFVDAHAADVDLERFDPGENEKEFTLIREIDSGAIQIDIGDRIKSPSVPNRGVLTWISIEDPENPGFAGEYTTRAGKTHNGPNGSFTLVDTTTDFIVQGLAIGQKIFNITKDAFAIVSSIVTTTNPNDTVFGTLKDELGNIVQWDVGDEYKIQSDLEIAVIFEADDPGSAHNNMEELLGVPNTAVEMEIEAGLSGVDQVFSNGQDLTPGNDLESDDDLKERILGRWSELASGSNVKSYINFAVNSSPKVFDANAFAGAVGGQSIPNGFTDVSVVVSGPPGSRALNIGTKTDISDNFDLNWSTELAETIFAGIRGPAPLTDNIFLSTVLETPQNLNLDILPKEGFVFEEVQNDVLLRLSALFTVQPTVLDVKVMKVGETLLFSRLSAVVKDTIGMADYQFTLPAPGVDIIVGQNEVLTLGIIAIGAL